MQRVKVYNEAAKEKKHTLIKGSSIKSAIKNDEKLTQADKLRATVLKQQLRKEAQ